MDESRLITRSLAARTLIFLVPFGYFLFYILQGKTLLLGNTDHVDAQLPSLFAAKDALFLGQWPWWNPYIFNGTPLWGSTGVFLWYPLTWIELLAPRMVTLQVSTLVAWLQYFGVFLAGFLYFRILIKDEKWASFSTLAYGFSIPVAYGLAVGNAYLPVYIFLPLSLYFLHSHDQRPLRKNIIYLTIAFYCLFTGGFLQSLIYAMAILGSYVIFLGYQSNSRRWALTLIGIFFASLFTAALLSAPFWISTLYMARLVSRVAASNGVLESILHGGYLTPPSLWLRLILPDAFGFGMWVPPVNYVETMVAFCGISCLFLSGMALVSKPGKIAYYWIGFVVLSLLLISSKLLVIQYFAFGGVEIMYGRLVFLLPLGLAGLAGMGGKSLFETQVPRWKLIIFNPFNALLIVVFYLNNKTIAQIFTNALSMIQGFYVNRAIAITKSNLPEFELLRAGLIILTLALLLIFFRGQRGGLLWAFALILLLIEVIPATYLMHKVQVNPLMISSVESFFAFDKVKAPLPFSVSDLDEFRLVVTEKRYSRKENEAPAFAQASNQSSVYGYRSPWGYANAYSSYLATLIQTVGLLDLDPNCDSGGMIYSETDISYNAARQVVFDPLCHPRLADLMSVGAVIEADSDWKIVADRRDTVLPRIGLYYKYKVIHDSVEASKWLAQDNFNIYKTLIMEKQPTFAVGPVDPHAQLQFVKNTPNEVAIQVHSSTPVLLLLTDTYSPGWIATVDGQPVEIIRSNVAFRSVSLPAGEHTVTFRYNPPLLIFSLIIQAFGVIGFLIIVKNPKQQLFNYFDGLLDKISKEAL